MALKTFNIDDKSYKQFSEYCKKRGISMSKRVEHFIMKELEKINEHEAHHVNHQTHSSSDKSSEDKHETPSEHHSFAKYC